MNPATEMPYLHCIKCGKPTIHAVYADLIGIKAPPNEYVACCQGCRPKPRKAST